MRLLTFFGLTILLIFTTTTIANAATAVMTTVTTTVTKTKTKTVAKPKPIFQPKAVSPCKHHKHRKHKNKKHIKVNYYNYRDYYSPGYCITTTGPCGETVCDPGYYHRCQTDYYYQSGRNTARVEVCY